VTPGCAEAVSATETFAAIGTTVSVTCTDRRELGRAAALMRIRLGALDGAVSRFREDSELARINARSAALARTDPSRSLRVLVGTTLSACLTAALRAERLSNGLVCASLGAELAACGYDADLAVVTARGEREQAGALATRDFPVPGRRRREVRRAGLVFDSGCGLLVLPAGVALDLGASAKAWAADTIAAELAATGTGGYLCNLGGDIAVAGAAPPGGWAIGVRDWTGTVRHTVCSTGQAFATSSTKVRTWIHQGSARHHIIDPRSGSPARAWWAQVSCAAPDAVQANAASTAAVILGAAAPRWLRDRGVAACLIGSGGRITTTPGWEAGPTREARPR